jgi:threonylcarbamoyladenosine tRNA methylthiotransferase MtaB
MKAAVVTMGCKVNQADSAGLLAFLSEKGFDIGEPFEADVVVLNACAVTAQAEKEAFSLIRRLRRRNPGAFLAVAGCLAQLRPELLTGPQMANLALPDVALDRLVDYLPKLPASSLASPPQARTRTRAFVKIQDGCSCACAYCVVPLARGPSWSIPPNVALEKLRSLLADGTKEAVLTGVHLGHYGLDLGWDLGKFLAEAAKILPADGSFRLRLSSIEPMELRYVREVLGSGWLAPHIHAPLQSGSDAILRRMGRPYAREDYKRAILELAADFGPLGIGSDVMVGFPGESEEDFQRTFELISELPISYVHVFAYSPRPGTAAAGWPGQVSIQDKKERSRLLKILDQEKRASFLKTQYPLKHWALVENAPDSQGRIRVLTGSYVRAVWVGPEKLEPNSFVWARLSPPKEGNIPEARLW